MRRESNMSKKIRWPFLLAAAVSVAAASLLMTERPVLTKEGEESMKVHTERKEMKAALPPIDAEAPKRTETATFALG